MNWIDLVLLLVFLFCCWSGWHRGFIDGGIGLLNWIISFMLAYRYYPAWAGVLGEWFPSRDVWLLPAAFISITLISLLLLGIVTGWVRRRIPPPVHHATLNRVMGLVPGAIHGWIACIALSALLLSLPLKKSITEEARNSRFANPLAMQSERVNRKLAPVFDQAVRQTMTSLTVKPGSEKKVSLGYRYASPKVRPGLEDMMLALVNETRLEHGLQPLQRDPDMQQVARAHSRDMFARGFFAHDNPDGKNPFDRMKAAGVSFKTAGENLALAQTVEIAHQNLLNSPGHRANILNPDFGRLGIGILDGGFYGLMISQEFRN